MVCNRHQSATNRNIIFWSRPKNRNLNNVLGNLPFNVPFQVFHEPITYAKTALATLKSIYDGKEVNATLPLAIVSFASLHKKSPQNNLGNSAWIRNFLRCNS